jgi:hypothetical protein
VSKLSDMLNNLTEEELQKFVIRIENWQKKNSIELIEHQYPFYMTKEKSMKYTDWPCSRVFDANRKCL